MQCFFNFIKKQPCCKSISILNWPKLSSVTDFDFLDIYKAKLKHTQPVTLHSTTCINRVTK